MDIFILILKLSAGVGLFLFAMNLLEESLKNLSGRNFKLFLQRITKNKISRSSKSLSNSLTRFKIRKPKLNEKKKSNDSVDYKNIEQLKHIENTQNKYNIENF